MVRFVGLAWNPHNASAAEEAQRLCACIMGSAAWKREFFVPGLCVFGLPMEDIGCRVYLLPGSRGIVIGRVFPRKIHAICGQANNIFTEVFARDLLSTGGRKLVTDCWGHYVAFLQDASTSRRQVIRDCSGRIPVYRLQRGSIHIFASDMGDIADFGLSPLSINFSYLAAFVHASQLQIRDCGLTQIKELLAGDSWTAHGESCSQASLWNPTDFYRSDVIDDFEQAVSDLKATTRHCIATWATAYQDILLSLSGGLDSTIVLSCLCKTNSGARIRALNRYHEDAGEDERAYAKAACEMYRVPMIAVPWSSANRVFDEALLQAPRTAKPTVHFLAGLLDIDLRNKMANGLGAETIWTGQGGDHLFFQSRTPLGVADYLHRHLPGPRLLHVMADAAHLSRESYYSILRGSLRARRRRSDWTNEYLRNPPTPFINRAALPIDDPNYGVHPWIMGCADDPSIPPGKFLQVAFVSELVNRHIPMPRIERPHQLHPLISQPLLELCLRIPTYLLLRGGHDRAVARAAFRDDMPISIFRRRDKGTTTYYLTDTFRRSLDFLRPTLLEGVLVKERILDRTALEPYLAHSRPLRPEHLFPLFACIAAELWARRWQRGTTVRAAA